MSSGYSNAVNQIIDGTLQYTGSGAPANAPIVKVSGNGTGEAFKVTAANVAAAIGANIVGGGTTQTSAVLQVDGSTSHSDPVMQVKCNAVGTQGLLISGNPATSGINIGTTTPALEFQPGGAGLSFFIQADANPAQGTTIHIHDPATASVGLALTGIVGANQNVTQATSNTTAVTTSATAGKITMFGAAAAGASAFTLNNVNIQAGSCIIAWSNMVSATSFIPVSVAVSAIVAGSCTITLTNNDGAHATLSAPIIYYLII